MTFFKVLLFKYIQNVIFNSLAGEIEIKSSIQLGVTEKKQHKPIDDHAIFSSVAVEKSM